MRLGDVLLHLILGGQGGYGGCGGRGVQGRGGQQGDVVAMGGHKDGGRGHEKVGGGVGHTSRVPRRSQQFQLSHLLLPNVIIAVWYKVLLDLCESKGQPGIGLCGWSKCSDLHMEVLLEMTVLGIPGESQLLLPLLVPHGTLAQHGHLGQGVLLHPLQGVPLRTQQLPNKVKLKIVTIFKLI